MSSRQCRTPTQSDGSGMIHCARMGVNFEISTPEMRFYDLTAMSIDGKLFVKVESDASVMSERIYPEIPEHECDEVLDACRTVVISDLEAGLGDKLAQLYVPPLGAAVLCHADYFTETHIQEARERIGSVSFPGVVIEGAELTVKVLPDMGNRIATADVNGQWIGV